MPKKMPNLPRTVRHVFLGALIVLMGALLAGCWDRTEIEDLTIILSAAFDKAEEGGVQVSLEVFVPKSGGEDQDSSGSGGEKGGGDTTYFSASGSTVGEALYNLQNNVPRYIFWGHAEIYFISQDLAREGLLEHIDFLLRFQSPRLHAFVFLTEGKASDFLRFKTMLHENVAAMFKDLARSRTALGVSMLEAAQRLYGESKAAYAPLVAWTANHLGGKVPSVVGMGIISKDRYVGRLSEIETEGLMWLRGENKRLYVSYCDAPKECLSLRVRRNLVDTMPHWDGKKLTMRIRISANADVVQNNSRFDITDMLQNEQAEKELERQVIKTVQQAVRTTQEKWQTDIFDFAEKVHRKYPKEWNAFMEKEWSRIYSEMALDTSVSMNIARSGSATSPMKKKVGED